MLEQIKEAQKNTIIGKAGEGKDPGQWKRHQIKQMQFSEWRERMKGKEKNELYIYFLRREKGKWNSYEVDCNSSIHDKCLQSQGICIESVNLYRLGTNRAIHYKSAVFCEPDELVFIWLVCILWLIANKTVAHWIIWFVFPWRIV
jgi:hypothetical protein